MVLIASLVLSACSKEEDLPPQRTNQIVIEYVYPENPPHQQLHDLLKKRQTLEKFQVLLSPFLLRWPLYMTLTDCDGETDAWYGDDEITICYEYIEVLQQNMPTETTPAGIEPLDTVVGPFVDTVLHEFSHALFDYADIPVLGREEDAADQLSAMIYLNLGKEEARRLIMGTVYRYIKEVEDTDPPTLAEFADEHGTDEQRRFNLLCMAYGADPKLFADIAEWGGLPEERAEICEEEFEHIADAYEALIGPHVDPDLAAEIFDKSWLPEKTSHMLDRRNSTDRPR